MEPFFEPVRRTPLVRPRLELAVAPKPNGPVDWDEVRQAIGDALSQLAEDVVTREPSVVVKPGTTRGGVIELFVFCSFALPMRANAEAIVVGVTIQRNARGFLLTADVCGEESGRVYAKEGPLVIGGEPAGGLVEAAGALAARLIRNADVVLDAVRNSLEV